jgi:hypothetical protein
MNNTLFSGSDEIDHELFVKVLTSHSIKIRNAHRRNVRIGINGKIVTKCKEIGSILCKSLLNDCKSLLKNRKRSCKISLFTLLCKDSRMRQGAFVPMLLTACLGCLIPGTLIDLCRMATMRCRALMQPAMILLLSISAILSMIGFFVEKRRAGGRG